MQKRQFILLGCFIFAALTPGQVYDINLVDVDDHKLSTADGHVTVIVLTPREQVDKAEAVGDRIPDYCLGDPGHRMITVIGFDTNHSSPVRALFTAMIRHHLDNEAKRLQPRYSKKNLTRDARNDLFAVADLDGNAATQLGEEAGAVSFSVFVFGRDGRLVRKWNDVPTAEDLSAALKETLTR